VGKRVGFGAGLKVGIRRHEEIVAPDAEKQLPGGTVQLASVLPSTVMAIHPVLNSSLEAAARTASQRALPAERRAGMLSLVTNEL